MIENQTTLQVTFVSESAGYRNTFGWYNKVTGEGGILFGGIEAEGHARTVKPGLSQVEFAVPSSDLGDIEYFLVPNGGGLSQNSRSELSGPIKVIQLGDGSWAIATVDARGNVETGRDGKPNILVGSGAKALFTEVAKNPGGVDQASSASGRNQTASTLAGDTADGATGLIAWEDMAATKRSNGSWTAPGDADYNDAVFRVSVKNKAPEAKNDKVTLGEDAGATEIDVLANDRDPEGGNLRVVAVDSAGVLGAVAVAANGTGIVFTPGEAYDRLGAGETRTETIRYTVADAAGATDTASVTVKIVGANDAPTVGAAVLAGSVSERGDGSFFENRGSLSTGGTIAFADPDGGDRHSVSVVAQGGTRGTLDADVVDTTARDGTGKVAWTYAVAAGALDDLAAGQTLTETFTVTIKDHHGGTVSRDVVVTLVGTNDAPEICSSVGFGTVRELADLAPGENTAVHSESGTMAFVDVDLLDTHAVAVVAVGTNYRGGLTASISDASTGDGSGTVAWTYSVDDAALDDLAPGQTVYQTYKIVIDDGKGGVAEQKVVIKLVGSADVNHGPTAVADAGEVTEAGIVDGSPTASGNVLENDTDPDVLDVRTVQGVAAGSGTGPLATGVGTVIAGNYGSLVLAEDGSWSYELDDADADTDGLAAGETAADVFTYTMRDSAGATSTATLTVDVSGANDAPVITSGPGAGTVAEAANASPEEAANIDHQATGTLAFTDVDLADTHSVTVAPVGSGAGYRGSLSAVVSNPATGAGAGTVTWSFTVADAELDALGAGQSATQTYTVTVNDGRGGTASQTVEITLDGAADAPLFRFVEDVPLPTTIRVSVDADEAQANGWSYEPSISADGRYVAFASSASNLVAGDTNGTDGVFVRDTLTGETTRVSVDSDGAQANSTSYEPSISADGRYVAFTSYASNLVADDTNGTYDVFVRDTLTGETTRVSLDSDGTQANNHSYQPSISADGRYVAFISTASNLVADDTNGTHDVFVRDTLTGETTRVSLDSDGAQASGESNEPTISADGRYVAFRSYASNLVAGDTNGTYDVFVRDTLTGETIRVSVDSGEAQANGASYQPSISADGRYVAFISYASNLVADDTNGVADVFVRDTLTGETTRVSVDSGVPQTTGDSYEPSISADGRYVAFSSYIDGTSDVFVRDLVAGTTIRLSKGQAYGPSISADGRHVAFYSEATELVADDTNGTVDIFSVDVAAQQANESMALAPGEVAIDVTASAQGGTELVADWGNGDVDTVTSVAAGETVRFRGAYQPGTTAAATVVERDGAEIVASGTFAIQTAPTHQPVARVSLDSDEAQASGNSDQPSISADGRFVAFSSSASNVVAGDTNGRPDVFVRDTLTGQTTRVSVDSDGAQANASSYAPSISADGRYVAFYSSASNLVAGDTNGRVDVFVRDTLTGETTRVSVDSGEAQASGDSYGASISADGRYVAFRSYASNLVAGDTNGTDDVFVRDTLTGETTRVSVDSGEAQANSGSYEPSISADGRYVAFYSYASNLVAGDTNGTSDVFVRDTLTGETTRVSVDSGEAQADGGSYEPSISADGRYVAFYSHASNLVAGDTNGRGDVFVRDTLTGETTRVSVDSVEAQASGDSYAPSISADGRYVAFYSYASNLVADDTNGAPDVFLRDLVAGTTIRMSNGNAYESTISADGRYVAFKSYASNLVAGDTNGAGDIFVFDRATPGAVLAGGPDTDLLQGNGGPDVLSGLGGDDLLIGGAGDDRLVGGAGADIMTGGADADTFVFAFPAEGLDEIRDFTPGLDHIEISASGFGGGLAANTAVTLITAADHAAVSAAGTDGVFIFENAGPNAGTLFWDANGGSGTDAVALAKLQNVTSLLPSDFHVV